MKHTVTVNEIGDNSEIVQVLAQTGNLIADNKKLVAIGKLKSSKIIYQVYHSGTLTAQCDTLQEGVDAYNEIDV